MKSKRKLILVFLITIFFYSFQNSYSQGIPSYTLQAVNGVYAPDYTSVTFDLVLTHNDATPYEYAGALYMMAIPEAFGTIAPGPATAGGGYQYELVGGVPVTDFPAPPATQFIPRNPSAVLATVNGVPSYELRLAANALPGAGSGFIMPQGVPFLIIRMKIVASTGVLNPDFGNLIFRDSCTPGPLSLTRTKLNAYVGTNNQEITRCANHFVDSNFFPPYPVTCNLKIAIEGLYNPVTDMLRKKDSVSAYLRNINSPYQIIDSAKALIDSITLTGSFPFPNAVFGTYYIVVKHKNSLETWSKSGGEFLLNGSTNNYDFTVSSSQAYGNNMVLKGSRYCIYSGNINQDNIIDLTDMFLVDNAAFNYTGGSAITNLNADNIVDIDDLAIVDRNARSFITVQKPGAILSSGKNMKYNFESLYGEKR
ncbi:MAG: hypothetical protein M3R36_05720 [Bacteroidota bacterium]|nr:hypothetical protein [Bacteroidota bacterium]